GPQEVIVGRRPRGWLINMVGGSPEDVDRSGLRLRLRVAGGGPFTHLSLRGTRGRGWCLRPSSNTEERPCVSWLRFVLRKTVDFDPGPIILTSGSGSRQTSGSVQRLTARWRELEGTHGQAAANPGDVASRDYAARRGGAWRRGPIFG